jgi:phosphoserine phosphatase
MALAIFDLDETLIHGDCATLWSEQMARLGWVDPNRSCARQRTDGRLRPGHGDGRLHGLQPGADDRAHPEEIEHLVGPWVEDFIEPIIFSDATKTIAEHRKPATASW